MLSSWRSVTEIFSIRPSIHCKSVAIYSVSTIILNTIPLLKSAILAGKCLWSKFAQNLPNLKNKTLIVLMIRVLVLFFCGIDWNRTSDARIFSPSLYQLSYDAISDLEVQIYK